MPNKLILVDNTRQAAVMQAVLGKAWAVHVIPPSSIHLPKDQLGVDIDHDFQPDFQITGMLGEAIVALKEALATAKAVYIATTPTAEGEWRGWQALKFAGLPEQVRV